MSDIMIKTYTTPCKSRSGNYSDGTTVVQSSGSVSYIGSGGSSVDIVKELGTDTLSDANIFSSLRTIKEITDRGHTHANKSALDNLTQTVIDNSHTHSNKAVIDGITSTLVSDWNNAVHKTGDESIAGTKSFDDLKCTTSEFTGLMKAASITLTGILTAATINAATINQNGNAVLDASNYTNYTYSQSTIGSLIDTAKTVAVNTAKESAASLYLPLSGGTMTGIITMPISYQIRWGDNTSMIYGWSGNVDITGNTSVHGYLYASNYIETSGSLNVSGNASIIGQLSASSATINGNLFLGNHVAGLPHIEIQNSGWDIKHYIGCTYTGDVISIACNGYKNGSTCTLSNIANGAFIQSIGPNGVWFEHANAGETALSTYFCIGSNGYIGIGTSNPTQTLDVKGGGYFSDAVTLNSTLSVAGLATLNGGISTTNITADSLSVKSFTADISQTLAGSDYLTKSVSKLSENFVIPAVGSSVRVIVDDLEGFPSTACFASGDYIRFRAFNRTSGLTISDAWGTVVLDTTYGTNGFSNGTQAYTFTCTSTACAGLTVYKGSEVLDYGTSGSGLIVRTTLDSAGSPYSQISTWQTDPSNSANYSVHVRLGNLAGITNCSGYGLYTDNAFLTKQLLVGDLTKTNNYLSYDATNGLVIKGNLYAASGAQVATSTDVTNLNTAIRANANAILLCVTSTTYNQGISDTRAYADAAKATAISTASSDASDKANLMAALAKAKILYTDPTFKTGANGVITYNNTSGGAVTINRINTILGVPNSSGYCLEIKTAGTASPGAGGFTFLTQARANAVFVTRIIANIPLGYVISWYSNSYGSEGMYKWLTPQQGTGNWQEYLVYVKCGNSGTFSSTNFFVPNGPDNTNVTWYVAYATVYDLTDAEIDFATDASIKANNALVAATTAATTAVNNIQIGGRNIQPNAYDERHTNFAIYDTYLTLLPYVGQTITISFDCKGDTATYVWVYPYQGNGLSILNGKNFTITSEYKRYSYTTTVKDHGIVNSAYTKGSIEIYGGGNSFYIKRFKVELGNKPTDWTPAPEDVDASIATKVATSTYDAKMTLIDSQISSKVSQTDFNALGQRVGTAETSITQNARNIELKVAKDGVISAINQTSESVTINADKINLHGAVTISSMSSDALNTIQGYSTTAVNNIQIGGRNLLKGSASITTVGTDFPNNVKQTNEVVNGITETRIEKIADGQCYRYAFYNSYMSVSVKDDTQYIWSVEVCSNCSGSAYFDVRPTYNGNFSAYFPNTGGKWIRISGIMNIGSITDTDTFFLFLFIIDGNIGEYAKFRKPKIELGNKATDWTPAPEDVDASIATKVAQTDYNAEVTILNNAINAKVSQTDFNALGQRVSSTESSITQLPNTIDARITTQVAANGSIYNAVASSLTMTAEGISLFGKTIQLAGATTFVSSLNSTAHGYATTAKTEAVAASLSNTTTAINNLSLSGRNLISQNFNNDGGIVEITHNYANGYKYTKATRAQFEMISIDELYKTKIYLETAMEAGKTYILSFWYKCLGTTMLGLETDRINEPDATTAWIFYSGTVTMGSAESRNYIVIQQGEEDEADILISDVTLYEGTKYMGFNLSPEDVNDAMAKNLGYADYSALNTAATAGTTIITGGKINTVLIEAHSIAVEKLIAGSITSDYLDASSIKADIINVSYINTLGITSLGSVTAGSFNLGNGQFIVDNGGNLIANNAVISGNITATSGSIGGFSVSSNQLIATSGANTMLLSASLIRFQSTYDAVYLGSNTISSIAANSLVPMRVEVSRSGSSSDMYTNIGTYYYVDGATSLDSSPEYGNHAIYIGKGNICGFRRTGRRVTSNITASVMDSVFMVFNAVTITLPSSTAEDMQEYFIIDAGGVNITLNAGSGYNVTFKNTSNGGQTWDFSGFKTAIVVFDKTNSIWRGCLTAGQ